MAEKTQPAGTVNSLTGETLEAIFKQLMLKIRAFISWLIQNDWVSFNRIDDGLKQSELYNEILNKFRTLVEIEARKKSFKFTELYQLIKSHEESVSTLPFMGKFYVMVNPLLLSSQLTVIAQETEFNVAKEKVQNLICDCNIRHQYRQIPNSENLIKVGFGCDGHYNYTIYECTTCGFKWSSYQQEDSAGNTVFEKWSEAEFPNNKKYRH